MAASYLSRIENRHLEPRPHTLRKIALALGVPMSEIFQERSTQLGTLQCVITSSGNCVMNMLHSSHGKRAQPTEESYNPRQLQLLRMANYLIQTADKRLLDSLDVLLGALLNAERHKTPGLKIPPPAIGEGAAGMSGVGGRQKAVAEGKWQKAESRKQKAESRKQKAELPLRRVYPWNSFHDVNSLACRVPPVTCACCLLNFTGSSIEEGNSRVR